MSALSIRHLRGAQVLTAVSRHRYRPIQRASNHHKHVWLARSESDGSPVIVKCPLRAYDDDQRKAMRQLDTEIMILNGPLKNANGIRQLVDQIILLEGAGEQVRAGVFEYLDLDLHHIHLIQKRQLSHLQIKSTARQILKALSNIHKHNIVHTDLKLENIVLSRLTDLTCIEIIVKLIDFGVADIWSFGAIIGSLLMEPGAKLFQPMGGLAYKPNEHDREFLRSLWTIVPFPESFPERIPKKWREEISRFSPRLAPNGEPITLSFIGEIFKVTRSDWEFVRDILQVDPDERPTADELLQHSWLNS